MPQLLWPVRFEVTIRPSAGQEETYTVLTWLNEEKAVALASQRYLRLHPTATVSSTDVTPLGLAPRSADGTVDVGRDVHDRMEF
jgi:hypothetical protein